MLSKYPNKILNFQLEKLHLMQVSNFFIKNYSQIMMEYPSSPPPLQSNKLTKMVAKLQYFRKVGKSILM